MKTISETLTTEIAHSFDVLVCGGGVAGIAAALAAARSGKRVALCERGFMLGGLATAGLITIYLPLCDGKGRQVSFGLAEELLRLSLRHWHDEKHGYPNWIGDPSAPRTDTTPRFEVNFNPQLFAIDAAQQLRDEGVAVFYGTTAVSAAVTGEHLDAVIFESKSGRFAIEAHSFIDATGDADLAVFAGVPTAELGQGNVLAAWYYFSGKDGYGLRMLGASDIPDSQKKEGYTLRTLCDRRFRGLDGEEISEMMALSHDQILRDVEKRQQDDSDYQPMTIPTVPQLRMTRRIVGAYTQDDSEKHTVYPDSVGLVSDWRRRGPVYEVPLRTLYSPIMKNLLFAGRVTSVTDAMWDIMRVIPCCAVSGEAAGIAAAITDDVTALDIAALQAELRRRGVRLHESDL